MSISTTSTIRSIFSTRRPIDRPIEKVIDYYAADGKRLLAEVEEYEVTGNVEQNLRKFLEVVATGVRTGQVAETGIWVSGFYGSGKSSFTKYLGFALNPSRVVDGRPFLDLLTERIGSLTLRQELKTLATQQPMAVIMLDLGAEQLAASSVTSVSTVLYWKVLQWAGYSKEEKVARLEFRLDQEGRLDDFRQAYAAQFGSSWDEVHNDPLLAVAHADQLAPRFYPQEYPELGAFRSLRFSLAENLRDRVAEMLDVIRRKTGCQNILFLIDEAGQYVAPRGDLILNLDGLTRNFKELGKGQVWVVATGQQTLAEIVEKAAYNSAELNKLRDRFPISIELDARDIREITGKRLLGKSAEGEASLISLFRQHGQALATNTRLIGTTLFKGDVDEQSFVRLYPFLPQHFDLLLELVRTLARTTGGIGLRSAIRVIQDVLVDTSRVLPSGTCLLADQPVGRLATADQFFDTLRADIGKVLPHVLTGVDRASQLFPDDELLLRVAKAVGALQPIENLPRTAENIAALLYPQVGDSPQVDAVHEALRRLIDEKATGLVEDPQAGGFTFLSEGVKPLRDKRNAYIPTTGELNLLRSQVLQSLFGAAPTATLENAKNVRAGVRLGRTPIVGEDEEVQFRLEVTDTGSWELRRTALLTETTGHAEWKTVTAWLIRPDEALDDVLVEVVRSRKAANETPETEADRDVASFIRAERRAAQTNEEEAQKLYRTALLEGTLIFRGKPTPALVAGSTIDAATRKVLQEAAAQIYPSFHLVNIRPPTDLAAKFLDVERMDRMPRELDPLKFVTQSAGRPRVDPQHPALAEALRVFREQLDQRGTTRLHGNAIQDLFAAAPYGWSKDATRYVFAALLQAGEVVFHTPGGVIQTAGPAAVEAVRSTQAFGRIGVALRDSRPSLETLDRAASRLEAIVGIPVLALENQISNTAWERLPRQLDPLTPLATQLRLLGLAGADRAQALTDTGRDLLQQDGAASISVLGAVHSSFPEDLEWARQVSAALANGAERDIQDARTTVHEAREIEQLFPETHLVEASESDTLRDALASFTFYTGLADLRGVVRTVRERATRTVRERLAAYQADLIKGRANLEALPDWLRLTDDDRLDIASRLTDSFPPSPAGGEEIACLRLLLVRHNALPGLLQVLQREVTRRAPKVIQDGDGQEPVEVELTQIASPAVIATTNDLDSWLAEVRAVLANTLAAGAPVRIRVGR